MGPSLGDIYPQSLQDTKCRFVHRDRTRLLRVLKTLAERDAAADCLALRIRKNGTLNRRVRPRNPKYRRGTFIYRDRIRMLDVFERE